MSKLHYESRGGVVEGVKHPSRGSSRGQLPLPPINASKMCILFMEGSVHDALVHLQ